MEKIKNWFVNAASIMFDDSKRFSFASENCEIANPLRHELFMESYYFHFMYLMLPLLP